jgi:putative transposase
MGIKETLMKVVVKVHDLVALARQFEESPGNALKVLVGEVHAAVSRTLEQVMEAEIAVFLGKDAEREKGNKRNGFRTRTFGIKGLGALELRMPRDRAGRFESKVVPPHRRYDEATEKDIALLNLAGLSTRMLSHVSGRVLGVKVSAQEVSNSLHELVPAAKGFLERPLGDRKFRYLYVDGTNFHVRRSTVALEPTLVVLGVDEGGFKSILAMIQGDKDSRAAWEMTFARLKERGLDSSAVQLGIMDGLPGLPAAFLEAFPRAKVARCWVHKARNIFPLVPRRYQADFKDGWDAVAYADGRKSAEVAFAALKARWGTTCADAIESVERDLELLLVHYDFPKEHWEALRTTNPIERVNREFKRRSRSMETVSAEGLKVLLAFTALRLEYGWSTTPIGSSKLLHLTYYTKLTERLSQLDALQRSMLEVGT